jgi:hypothetical protein
MVVLNTLLRRKLRRAGSRGARPDELFGGVLRKALIKHS